MANPRRSKCLSRQRNSPSYVSPVSLRTQSPNARAAKAARDARLRAGKPKRYYFSAPETLAGLDLRAKRRRSPSHEAEGEGERTP